MAARTQIVGVRETIAELKQVDRRLERETRKRMRNAARPLQQAAQAKVPSTTPMSGWTSGRYAFDAGQIRSGIKVRTSTARGKKNAKSWRLLELTQNTAAGIVFDMAGRRSSGKSKQGRQFISNLNARVGRASRSMWPAAEQNIDKVEREVVKAVEDAAKVVNRRILTIRR